MVLAPMENVTDYVFREIIATQLPKPDVFFTEFTSAEALFSKGAERAREKLQFSENQHFAVAQIWGIDPESFYKAAKLIKELGYDGVDINMGCPDRTVCKKGAGAALSTNQELAAELIQSIKEGGKGIGISVKTRIGLTEIEDSWLEHLIDQRIDALTIHGRTAVQASNGEVNWQRISEAISYKNKKSPETVIIGNGDIRSWSDAVDRHKKYGVDGSMIGRGIFSNPWVFLKSNMPEKHGKKEYVDLLLKHMELYESTWKGTHHFEVLKKFFKMYVREFDGANELRQQLMECKSGLQVRELLDKSVH
jgi:tRNA-dihydrouridine synthase